MTTYSEFAEFIKSTRFDGDTPEIHLLNKAFGPNWSMETDVAGLENPQVKYARFMVTFRVLAPTTPSTPKAAKKAETKTETEADVPQPQAPMSGNTFYSWEQPDIRRYHGIAIVPLRSNLSFDKLVHIGLTNALRNALWQAGATVEYEVVEELAETNIREFPKDRVKKPPKNEEADDEGEAEESDDDDEEMTCEEKGCDNVIKGFKSQKGKWISAKALSEMSFNQYGKHLCQKCNGRRFAKAKGK